MPRAEQDAVWMSVWQGCCGHSQCLGCLFSYPSLSFSKLMAFPPPLPSGSPSTWCNPCNPEIGSLLSSLSSSNTLEKSWFVFREQQPSWTQTSPLISPSQVQARFMKPCQGLATSKEPWQGYLLQGHLESLPNLVTSQIFLKDTKESIPWLHTTTLKQEGREDLVKLSGL